ncbi:MAG: hypothetical protein PHS44_02720 [Candidatus Dojkabacteria bacterium]|jgi:hypothetical protein|nr:hypothetical protein [Candidatus Dojkabacteria bacterium]
MTTSAETSESVKRIDIRRIRSRLETLYRELPISRRNLFKNLLLGIGILTLAGCRPDTLAVTPTSLPQPPAPSPTEPSRAPVTRETETPVILRPWNVVIEARFEEKDGTSVHSYGSGVYVVLPDGQHAIMTVKHVITESSAQFTGATAHFYSDNKPQISVDLENFDELSGGDSLDPVVIAIASQNKTLADFMTIDPTPYVLYSAEFLASGPIIPKTVYVPTITNQYLEARFVRISDAGGYIYRTTNGSICTGDSGTPVMESSSGKILGLVSGIGPILQGEETYGGIGGFSLCHFEFEVSVPDF